MHTAVPTRTTLLRGADTSKLSFFRTLAFSFAASEAASSLLALWRTGVVSHHIDLLFANYRKPLPNVLVSVVCMAALEVYGPVPTAVWLGGERSQRSLPWSWVGEETATNLNCSPYPGCSLWLEVEPPYVCVFLG